MNYITNLTFNKLLERLLYFQEKKNNNNENIDCLLFRHLV